MIGPDIRFLQADRAFSLALEALAGIHGKPRGNDGFRVLGPDLAPVEHPAPISPMVVGFVNR